MTTVLLIVQMFVTLALIAVVLIQRSEGGGLGIGTSQGMGAFMGGRGTANLLTRTTAILGGIFFFLSLVLALMNKGTGVQRSLLDVPPPPGQSAPVLPVPGAAPTQPVVPTPPASGAAAPKTPAPGEATPAAQAPAVPAPAPSPSPAAPPPAPAPAAPRAPAVPTN